MDIKNLTFFLIDDDADDREIFDLALQRLESGHICVSAENGKVALEKLDEDEGFIPDYIFLDLNMPLFSGKECLREIKKIIRLKSVPVIVYSTSSAQSDIEETALLGADQYFVKPRSITGLSEAINSLISKPKITFAVIKVN